VLDDLVRSFAMSGLVITEELKAIEIQFGIELGHLARSAVQSPVEYYPQFEQEIRSEADGMSRHYEVFYCLENAIRKLIAEALAESEGAGWWDGGKIPEPIVKEVRDRIQRETDSGVTRRSDASIDYTTLGELSVIITSNWGLFSTILSSRRAVERVMSNLNVLRGPIAHCSPLSEDEVLRLGLAVKDWFRMIG